MERFEIVPAGRVYATQLAPRLRHSDKIEVWAASGMQPLEALLDSVAVSDDDMCWAATLNKLPVAMFGVNRLSEEIGGIWLLASPAIYLNKRDFMRHCRDYLAIMHTRYQYLTNFIDARNVTTMQWLPRLGFRPVLKVDDFGHGRMPFIQYVSGRKE
jgi:hypothetical protein